jgi:hypothetical protein
MTLPPKNEQNVFQRVKQWLIQTFTDHYLNKKNVQSIVLAEDEQGHEVLEVGVRKKYSDSIAKAQITNPQNTFSEDDLVPQHAFIGYKYIPTRVIDEEGEIQPHQAFQPGTGITGDNSTYGTGGIVATKRVVAYDEQTWPVYNLSESISSLLGDSLKVKRVILTNRHVVAKDYQSDEFYKAMYDLNTNNFLGVVTHVGDKNQDYALITVDEDADVRYDIKNVGEWQRFKEAKNGVYVEKQGERTGHTDALILRTGVTLNVNIDGENVTFRNMVRLEKSSDRGDSGSVYVDNQDNVRVLLNSGSNCYSYGHCANDILKWTGIEEV